ncbi:MAG: antitoxin [Actinomycetota bacterium]|nr:antitoxin [Actinomycetota bacterium]
MATIQIRDIPEQAYEVIRLRARAAGQSIQSYMKDRVVELAGKPTKRETMAAVVEALAKHPPVQTSFEEIAGHVQAERR